MTSDCGAVLAALAVVLLAAALLAAVLFAAVVLAAVLLAAVPLATAASGRRRELGSLNFKLRKCLMDLGLI